MTTNNGVPTRYPELQGKVALVTGGSSGSGCRSAAVARGKISSPRETADSVALLGCRFVHGSPR